MINIEDIISSKTLYGLSVGKKDKGIGKIGKVEHVGNHYKLRIDFNSGPFYCDFPGSFQSGLVYDCSGTIDELLRTYDEAKLNASIAEHNKKTEEDNRKSKRKEDSDLIGSPPPVSCLYQTDFRNLFRTNKYDLRITEAGIYYIFDYYPRRVLESCSSECQELTNQILNYKEHKENAEPFFTNWLMRAISQICEINCVKYSNVGLVAVPASKTTRESPLFSSIKRMVEWYQSGKLHSEYGFNKRIYHSNILSRITDVSTAHLGQRPTFEEHYDSIRCNRNDLPKFNNKTAYIILDDVTTTGLSFKVCKAILQDNGVNESNIYCLAVAKTIPFESMNRTEEAE